MSDEPYNKREIDIIIKGQNDSFDKLFDMLKEQNVTLKSIDTNLTTNQMEIALIKDTIKDYPDLKATVSGLVNYKWWIIGAVAAFAVLGGSVVLLFEARIDSKIYDGINDAVSQHFQKVQVINNN